MKEVVLKVNTKIKFYSINFDGSSNVIPLNTFNHNTSNGNITLSISNGQQLITLHETKRNVKSFYVIHQIISASGSLKKYNVGTNNRYLVGNHIYYYLYDINKSNIFYNQSYNVDYNDSFMLCTSVARMTTMNSIG
ncbi:hypothetical protein PIROE2DRAFT_2231 [Piromyces sp. E2]|nr:hypothetical protein PIROE2DRAFT_2231 [Piromyces sp. E2]|eukprot:OUM69804.1 hypothetical protein PIROE2DRAFT_2231 [Piromyces sp. E2]